MRSTPLLIAFLLCMILSFSVIVPVRSQPAQGDWVVTGEEVVENKTITLNGNLIVKSGGSLTLRNVTLTVNNQFKGQYGISIEPEGAMSIYSSKITSSDLRNRFTFIVRGDRFVMENSELRGVGWCDGDLRRCLEFLDYKLKGVFKPSELGLHVDSDDALIEGNMISESAVGLILTGSRATVRGNGFQSNDLAAVWIFSSHNEIVRNSIRHAGTSEYTIIGVFGEGNTIDGNDFTQESTTPPADLVVIRLGPLGWHTDPIWDTPIANNTIANNTVTSVVPSPCVFPVWVEGSSNNLIENNTSIRSSGIYVWHGVNNRIENNSIHTVGNGGIWLGRAHQNIVSNNRISGEGWGFPFGIILEHSSNNFILNNEVEGDFSPSSVLLFSSRNNTMRGNHISNTRNGLFLYSNSDGNTLSGNEIRAGPAEGASSITVDASSSNLIYQNNFIDEKGGPYESGNNLWHHEGKGNHWSSYGGSDKDGDGIGDAPYQISPNGVDMYPLINPVLVRPSPVPETQPVSLTQAAVLPTFPAEEFMTMIDGKVVGIGIIENKVIEVEAGHIPSDVTIRNSTLILGGRGPIFINASVTIENSVLIAAENGYGFAFLSWGDASIVIRNSEIHGAGWGDWGIGSSSSSVGDKLIIENSVVTDTNVVLSLGMGFQSLRLVNNTFSGMFMGVAAGKGSMRTNVLITGNVVHSSLIHAFNIEPDNATITNNVILRSWGEGIVLLGSNALVEGNTISNCALGLQAGQGNTFYHNNFINNTLHVMVGENNRWEFNDEGNYWSDYVGKDANLDGIGDTPYVKGWCRDSFPFMRENGWLEPPPEKPPEKPTPTPTPTPTSPPAPEISSWVVVAIVVAIVAVVVGAVYALRKRK